MTTEMLQVCSPHDGSLIQELPLNSSLEVDNALSKASVLFNDRSQWLSKDKRLAILKELVELMEGDVEILTRIAAGEGGKPYQDSRTEVMRAIEGVKQVISHLHTMGGHEIPMGLNEASAGRMAHTIREPIGVVGSISAFNHPLNLTVHQTVPMLAVGCPVIIKPATTTPLSCLRFLKLLEEAGLPEGWCQAIVTDNKTASLFVQDTRLGFFSFIGSGKVGWMLRSQVAPGVRCGLEHGGVAPVIMEPDADLDEAMPLLTKGGFYHSGQVCVSVQRIYAHESIAETVAERIAQEANALVVGDPLDPTTQAGPLILPREVDRVATWVDEAKTAGARVLCGGEKISDFYYKPTVLFDPPEDATISQNEVFGPVVCVYPYKDRAEALFRANGLPYGFQAAVFTQNLDAMVEVTQKLNATAVMVNDHTAFRVDWMPFGGRGVSGLGMGGMPYTMHETTREKMICIKSPHL